MDKHTLLEESILLMLRLRAAGYDTGLMGPIGEMYAEVNLGMQKAERGERGFDGLINGRKVSVKSKERVAKPAIVYAEIRDNVAGMADDLLLVQMNEFGEFTHLLAPISAMTGKKSKIGTRYYLKEISEVAYK